MPCRQFLCCKVGPVCPVSRCVQACCCPEQRRLLPELPSALLDGSLAPLVFRAIPLEALFRSLELQGAAPRLLLVLRDSLLVVLGGGDQPCAPLLRLRLRLGHALLQLGPGGLDGVLAGRDRLLRVAPLVRQPLLLGLQLPLPPVQRRGPLRRSAALILDAGCRQLVPRGRLAQLGLPLARALLARLELGGAALGRRRGFGDLGLQLAAQAGGLLPVGLGLGGRTGELPAGALVLGGLLPPALGVRRLRGLQRAQLGRVLAPGAVGHLLRHGGLGQPRLQLAQHVDDGVLLAGGRTLRARHEAVRVLHQQHLHLLDLHLALLQLGLHLRHLRAAALQLGLAHGPLALRLCAALLARPQLGLPQLQLPGGLLQLCLPAGERFVLLAQRQLLLQQLGLRLVHNTLLLQQAAVPIADHADVRQRLRAASPRGRGGGNARLLGDAAAAAAQSLLRGAALVADSGGGSGGGQRPRAGRRPRPIVRRAGRLLLRRVAEGPVAQARSRARGGRRPAQLWRRSCQRFGPRVRPQPLHRRGRHQIARHVQRAQVRALLELADPFRADEIAGDDQVAQRRAVLADRRRERDGAAVAHLVVRHGQARQCGRAPHQLR